MAETSGPWDGSGFTEDEWRLLFGLSSMDGLLREDGEGTPDPLNPSFSTSSREVTFSPGRARVRGHLYQSDSDIVIDVLAPSGSNQRIDYVVLRYDPSEENINDRIRLVLVQGNESSDPSAPSLTQDHDGVWEWPRIRIGPYGDGAISGAPWKYMGTAIQPITFRSDDPNARLPGMPTVHDSMVIDDDGHIWRYDANDGQYERLDAPQTGSISPASGWTAGQSPRWWVKDGLVHLVGTIHRSGDAFQLPTGVPGTKFTGTLPSAIRPGREMTLPGVASLGRSATSARHRQFCTFYYDGDNRLGIMDGIDVVRDGEQWAQDGTAIFLHGVSWVIF